MAELSTGFQAQLLRPSEVGALLRVSKPTVINWIKAEKIPYIRLPGGDYRIPMRGLVASLSSNFDLVGALDELVTAAKAAGLTAEEAVSIAGGAPDEN